MLCSHRKAILLTVLVLQIGLMIWGCHPKRVGPMGPDGKRLTWKEMGLEQRKAHMQQVILPRAAAVFRSWRPERFARVDATTKRSNRRRIIEGAAVAGWTNCPAGLSGNDG